MEYWEAPWLIGVASFSGQEAKMLNHPECPIVLVATGFFCFLKKVKWLFAKEAFVQWEKSASTLEQERHQQW